MGGIHSFFIEFKLFQLVVEEGGNFFSLRIFERGKHFMKSVFMGKNVALWLMRNIEHTVVGVNPKQFFMLGKVTPRTLYSEDLMPLVSSF